MPNKMTESFAVGIVRRRARLFTRFCVFEYIVREHGAVRVAIVGISHAIEDARLRDVASWSVWAEKWWEIGGAHLILDGPWGSAMTRTQRCEFGTFYRHSPYGGHNIIFMFFLFFLFFQFKNDSSNDLEGIKEENWWNESSFSFSYQQKRRNTAVKKNASSSISSSAICFCK